MTCTQKMGDNKRLEWMRGDSKFILKQNGSQLIQVEGLDKDMHGKRLDFCPAFTVLISEKTKALARSDVGNASS